MEWVHVGVRGQGPGAPSQGLLSLPLSGCLSPLLTPPASLSPAPVSGPLWASFLQFHPLSASTSLSSTLTLPLPVSNSLLPSHSPVPVSRETPRPKGHADGCVALRPTSWKLSQSNFLENWGQRPNNRKNRGLTGGEAKPFCRLTQGLSLSLAPNASLTHTPTRGFLLLALGGFSDRGPQRPPLIPWGPQQRD